MTFRPPDWERRLRDLERRADNRGTDIVRLWGRLPQAPELPGYAMPVIIPSSTAPPSTTTTTSTSTTTTSTTSTSTTSTTPPPLPCFTGMPDRFRIDSGQILNCIGMPNLGGINDLYKQACGFTSQLYTFHYRHSTTDPLKFIDIWIQAYWNDPLSIGILYKAGAYSATGSYYNPGETPANIAELRAALLGLSGSFTSMVWSSPCSGPSSVPFQISTQPIP